MIEDDTSWGSLMLRQHVWGHLGFLRERSRKFHGCRLSRYPNSTSTFQLTRLLISWDIDLNPGPNTAKTSCPTCSRTIAHSHCSLVCNSCRGEFHIKCGKVTPKQFHQLQKKSNELVLSRMHWSCYFAMRNEFVSSFRFCREFSVSYGGWTRRTWHDKPA